MIQTCSRKRKCHTFESTKRSLETCFGSLTASREREKKENQKMRQEFKGSKMMSINIPEHFHCGYVVSTCSRIVRAGHHEPRCTALNFQ